MGSKTPLRDYNDYQPSQPPKRRAFTVNFDRVYSGDLSFHFMIGKTPVCSILKTYFDQKQIDFFESISETTRI